MNHLTLLSYARRAYCRLMGGFTPQLTIPVENDPQKSNDIIYSYLVSDAPCMIARYGSVELNAVVNYIGIKEKSYIDYIRGRIPFLWWNEGYIVGLCNFAGFFPYPSNSEMRLVERFCELMIDCSKNVDVLGSWQNNEYYMEKYHKDCKKVFLECMVPFFCENPWTRVLKGKKVLVVHPFASLIEQQYTRRELLFSNDNILPEFELKTIQAVQSLGGDNSCGFSTWFDALDHMKEQIAKVDFDICILGCGAYGFPLASFVKEMGKKSVHLGGVTQILFGIKGRRWEEQYDNYIKLFNGNWVRPTGALIPKFASNVENACYW